MTSPVVYQRLKNFTQFALDHTADPYNASDHDAELNAIQLTLAGILANRALIQRDDGALANDSVHPDSLSTATLLLIEAAGSATGLADLVRGLWATATAYQPGQIVQNGTTSYICAAAHTSGVFSTDYTAGKWVILGETAAAGAAVISFSPSGNIAASNVQGAIEELDAEKAAKEGLSTQPFDVADATLANHAVSMGQIQNNSLKTTIATGTADALLATILSDLTVLADGMEFIIEAPGTNTLTAPTLNLTLGSSPTGAKPIVKGGGVPLIAGDIAGNKCKFVYDLSMDSWILLNPLYQVGLVATGSDPGQAKNLGLAFSVGGSALLASVVTATGSTPTSSSPVEVSMRSSSAGLGTFNVRAITAALSLTVPSTATLGHGSGTAGILHWYLLDNAGALELAVSSKFFGYSGIVSTTVMSASANSATVMYSASARASLPFSWIGQSTDTQVTAGTWAALPTSVNLVVDDLPRNGGTLTGPLFLSNASIIENSVTVAAHATAADIWTRGNRVELSGSIVTFTDFADAPQAGACVEVFCNVAHIFTNNANLIIDGFNDYVAMPGDRLWVRARSTTIFELHPLRAYGAGRAGELFGWPTTSTPGWGLSCTGAAVSRTTYAALFAAIGTLYGTGDGTTTFNLPNIPDGYALIQASSSIGTASTGDVKSHNHKTQADNAGSGGNSPLTPVGSSSLTKDTTFTGGSANLAAGLRVRMFIRY